MKLLSILILAAILTGSIGFTLLSKRTYASQDRETIDELPSHQFLLGTDELGRDRLTRLIYGTEVSLLLSVAAATIATVCAALVGTAAGSFNGIAGRLITGSIDLFLALPWLFLLLTVRASLPLNTSGLISVILTFALLGLLGWAGSARIVKAAVRNLRDSDFCLQARAYGCSRIRLVLRHILPNLRPLLLAQFWLAVPMFVIAEANLGLLGLGVAEPLPSWGGMLRELQDFGAVQQNPWLLAPALLLVITVCCFQIVLGERTVSR